MHNYLKRERSVPLKCFLILGGPVALFILNGWLVPQLGVPRLDVSAQDLLLDAPDYVEAAGRNRFLGAVLFFTTIVLIGLIAFAGEIVKPLTRNTRIAALGALLFVQAVVLSSVLSHQEETAKTWRTYHQLGDGVMEEVLSHGTVRRCQSYDDANDRFVNDPDAGLFLGRKCTENPAMQLFRTVLDVVNVLSGLGVAALVLGMILSLSKPPDDTPLELKAFAHGRNQRMSRRFLYLAGLMLSAGMFLTLSWMHWPMPMVNKAAHPAYDQVINATMFYFGVFYTLLIVTGFGPVMFLAARRSDALAMEMMGLAEAQGAKKTEDVTVPSIAMLDEWKASHGLRISMVEGFQAVLAAGSPLITAFAGSFSPI